MAGETPAPLVWGGALVVGLLASIGLCGCPPPDYETVELEVDLVVDPEDDPFDHIGSVRVCLDGPSGTSFHLFPTDPMAYLITGVPGDEDVTLTVLGLDLEPDAVRDEEPFEVIADAEVATRVGTDADPTYTSTPFRFCLDDCPGDCAVPATMPGGEAAIALRRIAEAAD